MTKDEGLQPIGFFLSGGSFLQTAIHAHEALDEKSLKLRFNMPVYYLYSHAIELTLKAFLRTKGLTADELASRKQGWGHDLLSLWNGCIARSLNPNPAQQLTIIPNVEMLAPYAASYEFRYVQTGFKTLPTLADVQEAAKALQAIVKPAAEASVGTSIPDRDSTP